MRDQKKEEQDHGAELAAVGNDTTVVPAPQLSHDDTFDEDGYREPWCREFDAHRAVHEFCGHHQINWCRACDRDCPACVDDPCCPDCGCHLFEEYHDWDCVYGVEGYGFKD